MTKVVSNLIRVQVVADAGRPDGEEAIGEFFPKSGFSLLYNSELFFYVLSYSVISNQYCLCRISALFQRHAYTLSYNNHSPVTIYIYTACNHL